jgi:transmembrane sensor
VARKRGGGPCLPTNLADVAAEFNRYNDRKLVIADDDARAIRIGGTFQASNVEAFVRLLHDAYGLRIDEARDEVKVSS